jgi:transcriptional regulator with XRE-family HTH domain
MVSAERAVPVTVLRDAVRLRVEGSTLRAVAAEVGLSFSGLRSFLAGTKPHPRTLEKLQAWFEGLSEDDQVAFFLQGTFFGLITDFPEEVWQLYSQERRLALAELALSMAHTFFDALKRPVPESLRNLTPEDVLRLRGELVVREKVPQIRRRVAH